jgi:nucleotide-binding universal stress UspA family protein
VLVGVDGSDGAQAALATAAQLFSTRIVQPVAVDEGHAGDEAPSEARAGDAEVIRLPFPSGLRPHGRAVAAALAACARDRSAAVLVVGSRGRSAVHEILGSVAMATLHHSYRPVMVVPGTDRARRRDAS